MQAIETALSFGKLLRQYREDLGYTQIQLAKLLRIDVTSLAKIESGDRKPPRRPDFYTQLNNVPGLSAEAIAALLETPDAPQLLTGTPEMGKSTSPPRLIQTHMPGLEITLNVQGDPARFTEEELEQFKAITKEYMELCLKSLARLSQKSTPSASNIKEETHHKEPVGIR